MSGRGSSRAFRWVPAWIVILLVAGGAWSWFRPLTVTAESEPAGKARVSEGNLDRARVRTAPVVRGELSIERQATGYLEPERRIELAMDAAGRVVECHVEEGAEVSAGQLLMRLDPRDRALEVEEAEADWLKIRAEYAVRYESVARQSDSETDRTAVAEGTDPEKLFAQGLISRQQVDRLRGQPRAEDLLGGGRQHEVRSVMSGLVQAEHRLTKANLALERTALHAPFSGRIANVRVEVGQVVATGEIVFELLATERLKVDVDVLAADMVDMQPGAPARVRIPTLDPNVREGRVHSVNPIIDPETGMGRLTVTLPNRRGRLMAGLFAYVDLETHRLEDRLLVPVAALLERQGRDLVFRIEGDRALWTYVETGARSSDRVEITKGLEEEDSVAVDGHFALVHEARVEVLP